MTDGTKAMPTSNPSNLALQKGADVLWERQFKGTPWEGKVGLINPDSMEEYRALALAVWRAVQAHTPETGPVYRKWPGEPPHCMSCDCGMTDEQKRTVPFEDYQTFHTVLMAIVYESKSFTETVKLASDALQHKPPSQKAELGGSFPESTDG